MRLEEVLNERKISGLQAAMKANIAPSDFYQAINGKKPFFPAWRKRLSETLDIPEDILFPEYKTTEVK